MAPPIRGLARAFLKYMTPQERRLWAGPPEVNRKSAGHFRRQAPIGPCIGDFAGPGRRLVMEADGGRHGGPQDRVRDGRFVEQGFKVLRFRNAEVEGNVEGVMHVIMDALAMCPPPSSPPQAGEGRRQVADGRGTNP